MTDPVIYTFTVGDYENPIFLRGDDLLDELEVCNILNEHTALLAVKRTGSALEIAARNRGYGELPLMDLWLKFRDALAALPEELK